MNGKRWGSLCHNCNVLDGNFYNINYRREHGIFLDFSWLTGIWIELLVEWLLQNLINVDFVEMNPNPNPRATAKFLIFGIRIWMTVFSRLNWYCIQIIENWGPEPVESEEEEKTGNPNPEGHTGNHKTPRNTHLTLIPRETLVTPTPRDTHLLP